MKKIIKITLLGIFTCNFMIMMAEKQKCIYGDCRTSRHKNRDNLKN